MQQPWRLKGRHLYLCNWLGWGEMQHHQLPSRSRMQ